MALEVLVLFDWLQVLGAVSPASSSGVSSAASNPSNVRPVTQALEHGTGDAPPGDLVSPSNPSTHLLTAESLMSPSEDHWLSLHRNLTSSEEAQRSDYIDISDCRELDSSDSQLQNSGAQSQNADLADVLQTKDQDQDVDILDEVTPDSLEDLSEYVTGNTSASGSGSHVTPSIVPNDLQQYPSENNPTLVLESEQLKVWCQKMWTPETLTLVTKLVGRDPEKMSDFHLKVCASGEDEVPSEVRNNLFSVLLLRGKIIKARYPGKGSALSSVTEKVKKSLCCRADSYEGTEIAFSFRKISPSAKVQLEN